jgi:hypothetical protein
MAEGMVIIDVLQGEIEAQIVSEVLEDRGAPDAQLRDSAYGGLFQFQGAWGTVLAPPEWADTVRDVIAEVRQSPGPLAGFD